MNTIMNIINDNNTEDVMDLKDVEKIWSHLQKTFALNIDWHKNELELYAHMFDNSTFIETFMAYGKDRIEPILNEMLQRQSEYPTWENMIRFLLKEKFAVSSEQKNYYRSGAWKTVHAQLTAMAH